MRRWLLQVDCPEADNLTFTPPSSSKPSIGRSQELFWFWTVLITGLLWVPYIVDRTMMRTFAGMAKPEPKPQAPGAAQDGTRSSATLAGRNVANCATEVRHGRAARHLHQKSSERIAMTRVGWREHFERHQSR
jgi:hypothetical protein